MEKLESLHDLAAVRRELGLSQAGLADVIGVSPRTVQSWEQGWRKPSAALARSLLLLVMAWRLGDRFSLRACWESLACSAADRERCLAYRSRQGHLCWFLTGNMCRGIRVKHWADKMSMCAECSFFNELLSSAGLSDELEADGAGV